MAKNKIEQEEDDEEFEEDYEDEEEEELEEVPSLPPAPEKRFKKLPTSEINPKQIIKERERPVKAPEQQTVILRYMNESEAFNILFQEIKVMQDKLDLILSKS